MEVFEALGILIILGFAPKFGKIFCRHRRTTWASEIKKGREGVPYAASKPRKVCTDCGKVLPQKK
jgi:hypothetical protein